MRSYLQVLHRCIYIHVCLYRPIHALGNLRSRVLTSEALAALQTVVNGTTHNLWRILSHLPDADLQTPEPESGLRTLYTCRLRPQRRSSVIPPYARKQRNSLTRRVPVSTTAQRRRHCVGGAPVNFCRRRRAAGPKDRRSGGGGAAKVPEKMSFYPQNFLISFSLVIDRKLGQNKYTPKMASAARREIIGGGGPINKSRRRQQIVSGGGLVSTNQSMHHLASYTTERAHIHITYATYPVSNISAP